MAVRKLKDDKGREYDVEVPDDEDEREEDDGDEETIYLDEEDIEWLRRKRREEAEASRTSQQTKTTKQSGTSGKVVRIRGKSAPASTESKSTTNRKRTLRLA